MAAYEEIRIKNVYGESFLLKPNYDEFVILEIKGLTPPANDVNVTETWQIAGGKYSNHHIQTRNIVFNMVLFGENVIKRKQLYRMFPLDSKITIYYKNDIYDVYIDGYVESQQHIPYDGNEKVQISVICPEPYWRDVRHEKSTTALVSGNPECKIVNNGDCDTGFVARIAFDTEDVPTISTATTQSETAYNLRNKTAYLVNQEFIHINPATETVNIFLNGVLQTPGAGNDYTAEYMTHDGWKDIWLNFPNGGLANSVLTLENIEIPDSGLTDLRHYERHFASTSMLSFSFVLKDYERPTANDNVVILYNGVRQVISDTIGENHVSWRAEQISGSSDYAMYITYHHDVDQSFPTDVHIYKSTGGTNISSETTIYRFVYTFDMGSYTNTILEPTLPEGFGVATNITRVYDGTELLDASKYSFVTETMADSSTKTLMVVPGKIKNKLTFEVLSKADTDISGYTQTQIDEASCLVEKLKIENTTSGEYIEFQDIKFRKNDVIEISTIPDNLYVKTISSDWMTEGESLISFMYDSGTFFKLKQGVNAIKITAESNAGYASATITAQSLYVGV